MSFNINIFKGIKKDNRYIEQLERLRSNSIDTSCIEETIQDASKNLKDDVDKL